MHASHAYIDADGQNMMPVMSPSCSYNPVTSPKMYVLCSLFNELNQLHFQLK